MSHLNRSLFLTATAIGSALALSTTLGVNPASAGTATANLNVSALVTDSCTISTVSLDFTPYDPLTSQDVEGTGTVVTTCTLGSSTVITLDQGSNPHENSSNESPLRRMSNGSSGGLLYYDLYKDQGRSDVWGNTEGTGLAVTGTGNAIASTVYGLIPSGQNVPVGTYNDTVVATVTF